MTKLLILFGVLVLLQFAERRNAVVCIAQSNTLNVGHQPVAGIAIDHPGQITVYATNTENGPNVKKMTVHLPVEIMLILKRSVPTEYRPHQSVTIAGQIQPTSGTVYQPSSGIVYRPLSSSSGTTVYQPVLSPSGTTVYQPVSSTSGTVYSPPTSSAYYPYTTNQYGQRVYTPGTTYQQYPSAVAAAPIPAQIAYTPNQVPQTQYQHPQSQSGTPYTYYQPSQQPIRRVQINNIVPRPWPTFNHSHQVSPNQQPSVQPTQNWSPNKQPMHINGHFKPPRPSSSPPAESTIVPTTDTHTVAPIIVPAASAENTVAPSTAPAASAGTTPLATQDSPLPDVVIDQNLHDAQTTQVSQSAPTEATTIPVTTEHVTENQAPTNPMLNGGPSELVSSPDHNVNVQNQGPSEELPNANGNGEQQSSAGQLIASFPTTFQPGFGPTPVHLIAKQF